MQSQQDHEDIFDQINSLWQSGLAHTTMGISPAGVEDAFVSWIDHLEMAPGKLAKLALFPMMHTNECARCMIEPCKPECGGDPRFKSESWALWPWRSYMHEFLLAENWWKEATTNIPGLDDHAEDVVSFTARQILDALCPANFPLTNPDLAYETASSGGANLVRGAQNAFVDFEHLLAGIPAADHSGYKIGKNLAVTPGQVVYRNKLIELIRYKPQTTSVYKEPVLIIPAWIMKYYILDLSPHNSLVNWLVGQGHTVFIISWKNPKEEDSGLGMDDYYRLGAMAAIDYVAEAIPQSKIHLTGYCLGGTLAMITAAAMARDNDHRLKSLSLFAAQGDFSEAGELMLFVSPSEVSFIKNMMKEKGYLDTKQMAGAFQMLRSYDLIWSKIISDYFEGRRRGMFDLMVWNEDATRMPYKMHSQYLEHLFLHNDFAEGRFKVEGQPVAAENIQLPVFAIGTETDHVAPWRSVHKIHLMADGDITFVLVNGGHNAGILSEPGHKDRFYHIHTKKHGTAYHDPDEWLAMATKRDGSWWRAWHDWLGNHSAKEKIKPPKMDKNLAAAPGTYIYQR